MGSYRQGAGVRGTVLEQAIFKANIGADTYIEISGPDAMVEDWG